MMARLIDADKLLEIYKKWIPQLLSKEDEGDRRGVETCIMVLEDMQTVDAVPVVRCKDCVNGTVFVNKQGAEYVDCVLDDYSVRKPTDYCSYGKRKEGAD